MVGGWWSSCKINSVLFAPTKMTSLNGTEVKALRLVEVQIMAAEAGLKYCFKLKKKDRINLILGNRNPEVKITHFVLMDMARKKG